MKYAILVAIREFAENAKTKGFWIGIMLFPIMIVIGMKVPKFLAKATPTRHFVLVDQSGEFGKIVSKVVLRDHARRRSEAYGEYLAKHMIGGGDGEKKREIDFESQPAEMLQPQALMEKLLDANSETLDLLATEEGWNEYVSRSEMFLEKDRPDFKEPKVRFREVGLPAEIRSSDEIPEIVDQLKPYLVGDKKVDVDGESKKLFAALIIPKDIEEEGREIVVPKMGSSGGVEYWSVNLADTDLKSRVQDAINKEIRNRKFVEKGVDSKIVDEVQRIRVPFTAKNPKKQEGKEEVSMADTIRQWAPIAFVYLLWVAILTVSQMLLNNTIEEKSNRIIEVLLSSVTPLELMMGKLLGIAAIGVTMTGTWILSLFVVHSLYQSPEMEFVGQAFEVIMDSNMLPLFGVYFILGYLFYAGIFLSIGAICNTLKDAQNFMGPVMLIMMVPLFTMFFIPRDPNGTLASFLSWIPLYSPFVMMNRVAADPPLFDRLGTLILMILSALVMLWLSAKIFRTGILRTGQPPRFIELIRWLRSS